MHVAQDARPIAKKHDSKIAHNSAVSPSLLEQGILQRALDSPEPHNLTCLHCRAIVWTKMNVSTNGTSIIELYLESHCSIGFTGTLGSHIGPGPKFCT